MFLVVILSVDYFPYADANNHAARYALIAEDLFGDGTDLSEFQWMPTPYVAVDVLGALLVRLTDADTALRCLAFFTMCVLFSGAWLLLRQAHSSATRYLPALVPLAFGWPFLYGFMNFVLSIGLALGWISLALSRFERLHWHQVALLSLGVGAIYFVHLAGVAVCLVYLGSHWLVTTARRASSGRSSYRAVNVPETSFVLLSTAIPIGLLALSRTLAASNTDGDVGLGISFRDPVSKLLHLVSDFYSFSVMQAVTGLGLVAIAWLCFAWQARLRFQWTHPISVTAIFLLLAYLIWPVQLFGAWDADVRYLLPLSFMLFCLPPRSTPRKLPRAVEFGISFAGVAYVSYLAIAFFRPIDAELTSIRWQLDILPEGSAVMGIRSESAEYRVDHLRHFIHWHVIDNGGTTNTLFDSSDNTHISHFTVARRPYNPPFDIEAPIRWPRVRNEYDLVVVLGPSSTRRLEVEGELGPPLDASNLVTVYGTSSRGGRSD